MKIGYARVSTHDQNLDRQIDQLIDAGAEKIYKEKITGTIKERPELIKLLEYARPGDAIIVSELTRLSRSTKDLIYISDELSKRSIELISLKENIDTTTATGKAMFGMLAVMAQFERDLIAERTREGLKAARVRGRLGGRPSKKAEQVSLAIKMYKSMEYNIKEITEATGISKPTLYRYLKKDEIK